MTTTTGISVQECYPEGFSIYGVITVNQIRFKAYLKYGFPREHQKGYLYSLEIHGGKKNWIDANECTISGWDYFGTNVWEVSAYKLCPQENNVNLYLPLGLHNANDIYTERIHDIILQQAPPRIIPSNSLSITDDFIGIKRDGRNNIIVLPEVHVSAYSEEEEKEAEPTAVYAMIPSESNEKKKKCVSCSKRQPFSYYNIMMDTNQRNRSCKHCMANLSTKRVMRFPSRAVSIHK